MLLYKAFVLLVGENRGELVNGELNAFLLEWKLFPRLTCYEQITGEVLLLFPIQLQVIISRIYRYVTYYRDNHQ